MDIDAFLKEQRKRLWKLEVSDGLTSFYRSEADALRVSEMASSEGLSSTITPPQVLQ